MKYSDDLVGVADPDKAQGAFLTLSILLQALGLPIYLKKSNLPVTEFKSMLQVLGLSNLKLLFIKTLHGFVNSFMNSKVLSKFTSFILLLIIYLWVPPSKVWGQSFENRVNGVPIDIQLHNLCTIVHLKAANVKLAVRTWDNLLKKTESTI